MRSLQEQMNVPYMGNNKMQQTGHWVPKKLVSREKNFDHKVKIETKNSSSVPYRVETLTMNGGDVDNECCSFEEKDDTKKVLNKEGLYTTKNSNQNNIEEYIRLMNEEGPVLDSHCHLDFIYNILAKEKYIKDQMYLSDWMVDYPVFSKNFKGCIANFIDPDLFHRTKENGKLYDLNWVKKQISDSTVLGATYGVHPNSSSKYNKEVEETLRSFCSNKEFKAKAIGEVGIDTYRSPHTKEIQAAALEAQLNLAAEFGLPVVIHCRGKVSESDYETERFCISIMQKCLSRFHTIHRHCFTMNLEVYKMWIEAFPNTYFGFTPAPSRTPKQKEAIKKIPLRRILLETDAPYFRPQMFNQLPKEIPTGPQKCSFPGIAICSAASIAEIKNIPLRTVLDATYENAKQCYELEEEYII